MYSLAAKKKKNIDKQDEKSVFLILLLFCGTKKSSTLCLHEKLKFLSWNKNTDKYHFYLIATKLCHFKISKILR